MTAMSALWWPKATRRPFNYRNAAGAMVPAWTLAGPFTAAPLGWVMHVVVGNGSPFLTFSTAVPPSRRFAHFWVAKNGDVEQYAPLDHKSWAQGAGGNGTYWSVETEGFPTEPFTDVQLATLAELHVWLDVDDTVANTPGERGIICHFAGGAAWGGHSCPDESGNEGKGPRSTARTEILRRAKALRTTSPVTGADMPLTNDDIKALWTNQFTGPDGKLTSGVDLVMAAVWGAQWREAGPNNTTVAVNAGMRLARAANAANLPSADAIAAAVAAKLPSGVGISVDQVKAALLDVFHSAH